MEQKEKKRNGGVRKREKKKAISMEEGVQEEGEWW